MPFNRCCAIGNRPMETEKLLSVAIEIADAKNTKRECWECKGFVRCRGSLWLPLMIRLQNQFLHAPIQQLADIEFVFRRARDFVDPTKLLELLAGLAEYSHHFPLEAELIDPTGKGIRAV